MALGPWVGFQRVRALLANAPLLVLIRGLERARSPEIHQGVPRHDANLRSVPRRSVAE
jgi:hypothetical protein